MKFNKNTYLFISVLVALLFVSSCKSKKVISMGGELQKKEHNQVISDVLSAEYEYKTITTKGSIEFKGGKSSQKVPAVFKIIKDSVLQASVRIPILGGEAMRITFTPDSVVFIDRLKKQYVAERLADSKAFAEIDFNYYNLQALLTNGLFIPGNKAVVSKDYNKYTVAKANEFYLLHTKGKGSLDYSFAVDASNRIASTLVQNAKKNIALQWSYSDFVKDKEERMYPTNMQAKVEIGKKRVDITIAYDKLEINKDLSIDHSISSKYTKVSFQDLLKAYIK